MLKDGERPPSLKLRRGEAGQVFLIVLLVMVIALTVGLSVASRNIVTLRTSREEKDSQRALAAAEAGIERYLRKPTGIPLAAFPGDPSIQYSAVASPVSGAQLLVNGGLIAPKDEGADIWLVNHVGNDPQYSGTQWSGNLKIYWGDASGACNNAAVEVAVVYDSDPSVAVAPVLKRFAYDPCAATRANNFAGVLVGPFTVSNKTFSYSTLTIGVTSGLLIRIVPLYVSSTFGVTGEDASGNPLALPSQGDLIDATGETGGTKRKIRVFKGYASLPVQYFLYGLFSP